MRSDLTPWTIRGAGIAAGIALVAGLIALAVAAGGVLILLFVAILLASALEPIVGLIRDRLPLGSGRDDPGRLRHVLRDRARASRSSSSRRRSPRASTSWPGCPPSSSPARAWAGDAAPARPVDLGDRADRLGREREPARRRRTRTRWSRSARRRPRRR